VLLKLGEIVLKGRNRQQFERILHANLSTVETRARLDDLHRIEGRLDIGELAEELARNAQEYHQEKS
jgi:adenylyl- and sulfurtransferase ThiI